jgi:hypothetical protein
VNARQSFGAAQRSYDMREPAAEWEAEPDTSIKCGEAINHLKAASRGFCDSKDDAGKGSVADVIYTLMDNPELSDCVIEAVRAHMRRNCYVEVL